MSGKLETEDSGSASLLDSWVGRSDKSGDEITPQSGASAPQPVAAPECETCARTLAADPVLLFRYSALTFNAHRIHYDLPYASKDEGYPGLVV